MELSIFLAKLIGIYFLIIAAIWIVRKDQLNASIKEFASSKGLIFLTGLMNIVLGLAIAIGHPIWHLNWVGLITLLGYFMLFKGIMRVAFTDKLEKTLLHAINKGYWVILAVLIVLGGFLTYSGFMMS